MPPEERLSKALTIYNRAFRTHLSTVLRQRIGSRWWEEAIVRVVPSIQETIEISGVEIHTDDDALSILEPKHYHWIVSAHRPLFPKLWHSNALSIAKTGGSPRTLMHEVADWRNVSAHPPVHLASATVDRAVEAMVCVVSLFDPSARDELLKLSGREDNKGESEDAPNVLSAARSEAKDIVAAAESKAQFRLNEATREAAEIRKAAKAEAEALRREARRQADRPPTSKSKDAVPWEDREKLDRVRSRVRELKEEGRKAASELGKASRNIRVFRQRADEIETKAKADAERIVQAARDEASAIEAKSRQSAAYQTLRRCAVASAKRDVTVLLEEAKIKAEAATKEIIEKAQKDAETLATEAHDEARAIRNEAEQRAKEIIEKARTAATVPSDGRAPSGPLRRHRSAVLDQALTDFCDSFKPAKSGNGFTRSFHVDGWWLTAWAGRARGCWSATVFAPSKTIDKQRVEAQDGPLMERDCNSEDEAFAWLHDAYRSGEIEREARRAVRQFERDDDEEADDDIPF